MPAKRNMKPTEKQMAYVENRAKGLSRDKSAIMAGYAESGNDTNATDIERSGTVQRELARIRAETAVNCGITKEDVVTMLSDAAKMAKIMADPQGLVAAARELGKMLGFYAPEVRRSLIGVDKDTLKAALNDMSDEELMKVANARSINGTSIKVSEQDVRYLPRGEDGSPVPEGPTDLQEVHGGEVPGLSAKPRRGSRKAPPREAPAGGDQAAGTPPSEPEEKRQERDEA